MNTQIGALRAPHAPPISALLFLPAKLIIHSYHANFMHKKPLIHDVLTFDDESLGNEADLDDPGSEGAEGGDGARGYGRGLCCVQGVEAGQQDETHNLKKKHYDKNMGWKMA